MVAGGIRRRGRITRERSREMALDMRGADRHMREGTPSIRIGINTGPVVAGVIGRKKFIYDLWGDTVNTASRMEWHGVPGEIQVTERVLAALGGEYRFDPRGPIEIKGSMQVWLLRGHTALDAKTPTKRTSQDVQS